MASIHSHCQENYGLSPSSADDLHLKYGSTIRGLCDDIYVNNNISSRQIQQFYDEVYSNIDYTDLLNGEGANNLNSLNPLTGYSHSPVPYPHIPLLRSLKSLSSSALHLCLTSNSPLPHVEKCLHHLGLRADTFCRIVTPSATNGYATKSDEVRESP